MKVLVSKLSHHLKEKEIYQLSDIDDLMNSIFNVGFSTTCN